MIIRQITLTDKDELLALIHEAYQSVEDLGIHFAAATADLALVERHLVTNLAYGVQKEGKLVSTLSIRYPWGNHPGPYGLPHLGWFATLTDYKQQGLSRQLFEWVEEHILIKQLKLPAVTLGTAKNHPWLIKVYKSYGFKEIGQADLGYGHTTVYLEKVLDSTLYESWQKRTKS